MITIPSISSLRAFGPASSRPVSLRQPSHLRITHASVQDSIGVDERFVSARVDPSPHLVSTREVHAAYVEAMDVRRQHSTDKENAVDKAVGAEVVEEPYGKRREEYVEYGYADSIAECTKHRCFFGFQQQWFDPIEIRTATMRR